MSNYENYKKGLVTNLVEAQKDKVIGPIKFSFALKGNVEPEEKIISEESKYLIEVYGFLFKSLNVYYDEGWSRIIMYVYDKNTVVEYIQQLEKENKEL